ncbi:HD domain-containing phosphohydrolase [Vibrio hangzhouensis]|uniref:GAF domain-containing protein n=1 Tax=Vibrio hangzhouensis TaxID=462991 RepID=A0A1H5UIK2_9VIBR|nr:HD domain-containing phosphohydrolase [Vibrio hangzhouensis]SEF74849.1 GAF domain-containing protein [Vibrio hangzhouensis]
MTTENSGIRHQQNTHEGSMNDELQRAHHAINLYAPEIVRVSLALFDSQHCRLTTYAHSTLEGQPLLHYSAPIAANSKLGQHICRRKPRVINDIPSTVTDSSTHSHWLLEQGYLASLTIPVLDHEQFTGLLFLDANQPQYFDSATVAELSACTHQLGQVINEQQAGIQAMSQMGYSVRSTHFEHPEESLDHAYRVGQYARLIALEVSELYQLNDETISHIVHFAELHDIGKYSSLSTRTNSPWLQDWSNNLVLIGQIQQGLNLVNQLASQVHHQQYAYMDLLKDIIQYHHEYLDGSGAPNGLSHGDIPVAARIVTVANIFDALTSNRHYSEAWSLTHALLELEKMVALGKLDGNCVHALRCQQDAVGIIMQSHHIPWH